MLQNYKTIVLMSHILAALRSQCQWTLIFISLSTPMAMGTQLGFKRHRESLLISLFPKNIVSTILSVIIYTGSPLPPPPPIKGKVTASHAAFPIQSQTE